MATNKKLKHMKNIAIIVAGGNGVRMQSEVPKQFLMLAGKPILMHTIEQFYKYDNELEIVLVLPADQFFYWKDLCEEYNLNIEHKLVSGGRTRFQSVRNGLNVVDTERDIIFIHDGVRPLVSMETIKKCEQKAVQTGSAIPVLPVIESLRKFTNGVSTHVNRNEYRLVQTPQTFNARLIKTAYKQEELDSFTDDASVLEKLGILVNIVEGNLENIKITQPIDLQIGEILMAKMNINK